MFINLLTKKCNLLDFAVNILKDLTVALLGDIDFNMA